MKKVIITGATGFIGGALAKKLLSQGVKVIGIDINPESLEQLRQYGDFVPVVADFSMYGQLDQLIEDREYDCFIHTAWAGALGGSDLYNHSLQNNNIEATCIACNKASQLKAKRFIFCSSSYSEMISEKTNSLINYYGIAKKAAADFSLAISEKNEIECNIAILTNTFGVGDRSKKAVNTFIRKMLKNDQLILIDGNRPNDWVYIDDTVSGIIAVALSPEFHMKYYIGHQKITTFKEKLLEMKSVLKSSSELKFGLYADNTYVNYVELNARILQNDTGFVCKEDFAESIRKTAEWVKTIS